MGGGPSKDTFADGINWDAVVCRKQFLGVVGIQTYTDNWLSWNASHDVRNDESDLRTQEKWFMYWDPETNMACFKLPYIVADNSTNYWLRATSDGGLDVEGQWIWHGAIFWRVVAQPDGRTFALKSMYDTYLSAGPSRFMTSQGGLCGQSIIPDLINLGLHTKSRSIGECERLRITQTAAEDPVRISVAWPFTF